MTIFAAARKSFSLARLFKYQPPVLACLPATTRRRNSAAVSRYSRRVRVVNFFYARTVSPSRRREHRRASLFLSLFFVFFREMQSRASRSRDPRKCYRDGTTWRTMKTFSAREMARRGKERQHTEGARPRGRLKEGGDFVGWQSRGCRATT